MILRTDKVSYLEEMWLIKRLFFKNIRIKFLYRMKSPLLYCWQTDGQSYKADLTMALRIFLKMQQSILKSGNRFSCNNLS